MKPRTPTARKLWFALIVGSLGAIGLIITSKPEPQAALREQWPVQVDVFTVQRSSISPMERAVGRLMPARRAILSLEVPGRVVQRLIEPGTRVAEGQALVQLDDKDMRDRLAEAEAQYQLEKEAIQRDKDLLVLAKRNTVIQRAEVKRLKTLTEKALSSGSQLDMARQTLIQQEAEEAQIQNAVRTASARLALRETTRDQALRQLERTTLRAPFAGAINRVEVDIGDYVLLDQPAVELLDIEILDLHLQVRSEVVAHLELGQTLAVMVDNRELNGLLHALQYDPDPRTFTHALRVRLPAQEARPGGLATVEIPLGTFENALVIPVSAVLTIEGEAFVFQHTKGVLRRKSIELGPRVGDLQVVYNGVLEGERIVARDVAGLNDAQVVEVTSEAG